MTYTEAENINVTMINNIDNIIHDFYKDKPCREADEEGLDTICKLHKTVDNYIRSKASCGDEIVYLIGKKPFTEMSSILVTTLTTRGTAARTYVFDRCGDAKISVFLLNNNGKTIIRY